jgi:hypothetical protein
MKSLTTLLKRREIRMAFAMLLAFGLSSTLSATPQALATAVGTNGGGWLLWALRIVGGMMAIGGILAAVSGFTGTEEGYGKVVKVGVGLLLLAIGGYTLTSAPALITTLGLANMFSAV